METQQERELKQCELMTPSPAGVKAELLVGEGAGHTDEMSHSFSKNLSHKKPTIQANIDEIRTEGIWRGLSSYFHYSAMTLKH